LGKEAEEREKEIEAKEKEEKDKQNKKRNKNKTPTTRKAPDREEKQKEDDPDHDHKIEPDKDVFQFEEAVWRENNQQEKEKLSEQKEKDDIETIVVKKGKVRRSRVLENDFITVIHPNPDYESTVFIGTSSGKIQLFDGHSGKTIKTYPQMQTSTINCLCYNKDKNMVFAGCEGGNLFGYNVNDDTTDEFYTSYDVLHNTYSHEDSIMISHSQQIIKVLIEDKHSTILISLENEKITHTFLSNKDSLLIVSLDSGFIEIHNTKDYSILRKVRITANSAIKFFSERELCLVYQMNDTLMLHSLNGGGEIREESFEGKRLLGCASNGNILYTDNDQNLAYRNCEGTSEILGKGEAISLAVITDNIVFTASSQNLSFYKI